MVELLDRLVGGEELRKGVREEGDGTDSGCEDHRKERETETWV